MIRSHSQWTENLQKLYAPCAFDEQFTQPKKSGWTGHKIIYKIWHGLFAVANHNKLVKWNDGNVIFICFQYHHWSVALLPSLVYWKCPVFILSFTHTKEMRLIGKYSYIAPHPFLRMINDTILKFVNYNSTTNSSFCVHLFPSQISFYWTFDRFFL